MVFQPLGGWGLENHGFKVWSKMMKKHLVALVVALSSAGLMAVPRPKAVVYVDHFIPVKG